MGHRMFDVVSTLRGQLLGPGRERAPRLHRLIEGVGVDEIELLGPIWVFILKIPDMHVGELRRRIRDVGADDITVQLFSEPFHLIAVARPVADARSTQAEGFQISRN